MRHILQMIRRAIGTEQIDQTLRAINSKLDPLITHTPQDSDCESGVLQGSMSQVRKFIAQNYLRGNGIEIGAFASPLVVPNHVQVRYVDKFNLSNIETTHMVAGLSLADFGVSVESIISPDILDDGETLSTVGDLSQDFVIANHVMEHFEDPIRGFKNMLRVLKHGGILYVALPEMRRSFDRVRTETSFEHILRDYTEGAAASREQAYREFAEIFISNGMDKGLFVKAHGQEREDFLEKIARELNDADFSIHFHAWSMDGMQAMFLKLKALFGLNFDTKMMLQNEDEVIFIFEKNTQPPP